jgi:hydroxymethylpyrimidine pyrophosphatase-like HAD family hydrolase
MTNYFHAVAIDYDSTLTSAPRPTAEVLAAVRAVRDAETTVLLVTGRILSELRADFPDVDRHFDAIVAENGAVLSQARDGDRPLLDPVAPELYRALIARGVPVRAGQVLLATEAMYDAIVSEEIGRLGLECQVERNRHALMVLPGGVTKGTGLVAALEERGLSAHSTVAIGDAENDHTLLNACEVGVAVANAVDALKAHADVILESPDGAGVTDFLSGAFMLDLPGVQPRRRCLTLGRYEDGTAARIPASRINILISGPSGSGKSYLAASLARQLIGMRYSVCVLDLEGDYALLGALHGVVVLGGTAALPPTEEVVTLLANGMTSVVVDLSLQHEETKKSYTLALLGALNTTRREQGLPHWIVVDEAHVSMPSGIDAWWSRDESEVGICAITYRPDLLCRRMAARSAYRITVDADRSATLAAPDLSTPRRFFPPSGRIPHTRHAHKYTYGRLPLHRRFYFRNQGNLTGQAASNLPEFAAEIGRVPSDVVRHHASHGDFSRWLGDLCRDERLITAVRDIESAMRQASSEELAMLRRRLAGAVRDQLATAV